MGYLEKNKIKIFSFILSVLVILVHSINMPPIYKIFSFENIFGIEYIGSIAAPGFFIISGFLYFVNVNNNDKFEVIKNKMIKRIHTIVLPFLMWNSIYYMIKVIYELIITRVWTFDGNKFFNAVFQYTESPHLWFLYQLILLIIITPIIFYVIKNKYTSILFFALVSILQIFNIKIYKLNNDALIYFYIGAMLSRVYNENEYGIINKKASLITIPLSIGSFFIYRLFMSMYFKGQNTYNLGIYFLILMRVFIVLSILFILDLFIDYRKKYEFTDYTFFIYCFHYMVTRFMLLLIYIFVFKKNMDEGTIPNVYISNIYFIFTAIFVTFISVNVAKILKNKLPKYYNYLSGGR